MPPKTEFDYTMLSTYQTCARKYDFRMNKGLVSKTGQSAPDFGKAIHKALDKWYGGNEMEFAIEFFKEEFQEDLEKDDKRTHKMGEWILNNYAEKYKDQPFRVVSCEQEFTVKLPNGNNLIGRIDKIIEWDNVIWVMDHKTTSQLGPQFMNMHTPNLQFSGYVYAAQQLGYTNCVGVLVDAILVAKGLLQATSRGKLTPLLRDFAYRSKEDVEEYLLTVKGVTQEIESCEHMDWWIPNWQSCSDYGECPYRRICKEPMELRQRIIDSDYKVEPWDPRGKEPK